MVGCVVLCSTETIIRITFGLMQPQMKISIIKSMFSFGEYILHSIKISSSNFVVKKRKKSLNA